MPNLTSDYSSAGGRSYSNTNVPEGPAPTGPDAGMYLQALLQREDEWRRQQYQRGLLEEQRQKAEQERAAMPRRGAQARPSTPSPASHGSRAEVSALIGRSEEDLEPYYTRVPTSANTINAPILAQYGEPGANFAGYRPVPRRR